MINMRWEINNPTGSYCSLVQCNFINSLFNLNLNAKPSCLPDFLLSAFWISAASWLTETRAGSRLSRTELSRESWVFRVSDQLCALFRPADSFNSASGHGELLWCPPPLLPRTRTLTASVGTSSLYSHCPAQLWPTSRLHFCRCGKHARAVIFLWLQYFTSVCSPLLDYTLSLCRAECFELCGFW